MTGIEDSRHRLSADTRGILDPDRMRRQVEFAKFAPPPELDGLVDWVWSVAWDLPAGTAHLQQVISHPSVNFSVGSAPPEGVDTAPGPYPVTARINGVLTGLSSRRLSAAGWNVAIKSTVGGAGAFLPGPVAELTDRVAAFDAVLALDSAALVDAMTLAPDAAARSELLLAWFTDLLARAAPDRVARAREVAAIGRLAERGTEIRQVADLAAATGIGIRRMQRLFAEYVGVSPLWVIRRYRLIDAANRVSAGDRVRWAEVAAELGYADQAHLVRDFTATVGSGPAEYAAKVRAGR